MYWGFKDEKHCTEYSVDNWEEITRDVQIGIVAGAVQVVFSAVTVLLAYYTEWHDPNNEEAYIKPKHQEKVSAVVLALVGERELSHRLLVTGLWQSSSTARVPHRICPHPSQLCATCDTPPAPACTTRPAQQRTAQGFWGAHAWVP